MDDLWGKKKDSKTDSENREALSRLSVSPHHRIWPN